MNFKELGIITPILQALAEEGYTSPTPIQEASIPVLLRKKDLMASAQTGTGKTASFAIPILQNIVSDSNRKKGGRQPLRALIVTPTRELAIQIGESFTAYGRHTDVRNTVIFGGVKQGNQTNALQRHPEVLIATPGRLLDLMNQGYISLRDIEYFILDEADRMLDMGFIHDVKRIIRELPERRQSLFFSATMPQPIIELSAKILHNAEKVIIKPEQTTAEKINQSVYFVEKKQKASLLIHLLEEENIPSAIVFSRTKHGANKIVKQLDRAGISSSAIHGNKSQGARQKSLSDFKNGDIRILVATDIAARGIDIDELSHVINFDLPNVSETYVHRIGRTGRAGASGRAISFCDLEERAYLKDIQQLIRQQLPVIQPHPYMDADRPVKDAPQTRQDSRTGNPRNRNSRNRYSRSR
ncbi:DEAD/DEAH box helicase [Fulvivirga sedimenti]|uniref:DEAD/DEAH box helicase n=1 Tax=Fulvivirga sedimenti TaxID=2879465 RepID=A0A9X1HS04_9BACT|nr:DEAD/DEAH box helicase [Fulvivirga sedimenti]MCA6074973.1 DEAD/DEAH box helicase [Fulvivirga sedimenti]MCA6076150.1 DEAD/DEAH box helicase [Fulvivirga sedimenti]MCA6077278.1 DEAD/DEAH box helicase [Fulvivirga sedimenti]